MLTKSELADFIKRTEDYYTAAKMELVLPPAVVIAHADSVSGITPEAVFGEDAGAEYRRLASEVSDDDWFDIFYT